MRSGAVRSSPTTTPVGVEFWERLDEDFPDYQTASLDDGEVVAKGCSIPLRCPRVRLPVPHLTPLTTPFLIAQHTSLQLMHHEVV